MLRQCNFMFFQLLHSTSRVRQVQSQNSNGAHHHQRPSLAGFRLSDASRHRTCYCHCSCGAAATSHARDLANLGPHACLYNMSVCAELDVPSCEVDVINVRHSGCGRGLCITWSSNREGAEVIRDRVGANSVATTPCFLSCEGWTIRHLHLLSRGIFVGLNSTTATPQPSYRRCFF